MTDDNDKIEKEAAPAASDDKKPDWDWEEFARQEQMLEEQRLVMFQVRLPAYLRKRVKMLAAAHGVTVQEYIAKLIHEDMPDGSVKTTFPKASDFD